MLEELAKKDKYPISKGFKIDTLKLTVGGARHPTAVDKNDILNKKINLGEIFVFFIQECYQHL